MTGLTSCAFFGLVCIRKHFKVLWYLLIRCKILICKILDLFLLFFICRKNFIQSTEKNWECFCSEPAVAWLVNLLKWWATRRQGKRKVNLSSKLHRLQCKEQKTKYHVSYCYSQKESALVWEQDKKRNLPSILINHGLHRPYCLCLPCSYKIGLQPKLVEQIPVLYNAKA